MHLITDMFLFNTVKNPLKASCTIVYVLYSSVVNSLLNQSNTNTNLLQYNSFDLLITLCLDR